MSFRLTALWRWFCPAFLALFFCVSAAAQDQSNPPAPVVFSNFDAISVSLVTAPRNGGNSNTGYGGQGNQWLLVEFHYAVNPPPRPGPVVTASDFLPQIEFKVWVEGRDQLDPQSKGAEGISIALTGSVTYVNVSKGRDNYGAFFVHPSSLSRFTNSRGANQFLTDFNIHLEANVDGKVVAAADRKKEEDPKWFTQLRAIPGFVYRQNQCPFLNYDPDKYPAIQVPPQ